MYDLIHDASKELCYCFDIVGRFLFKDDIIILR